MSKKRLSILIYSLASGGAERVVSILLNELPNKYDITLVLMKNKIEYDIPKEIKIAFLEDSDPYESGIAKLLKLPYLGFRYKRLCKENQITVSLSFMNRPNYINIFAKLFGNRARTIISERAMPSLQHKVGIQGKINRFLIKQLYPYSDVVTANSMGNSLDLRDNFGIDGVVTINNPFDIEKIEKESKESIELKRDRFVFITIGRLDSGKNHKLMIDAIREIDANLYIIGEGELREELETQIEKLELENRVSLLGRQNNPYKYLSKADCFIFTSNYEGFPNVLVEALSCKLPVISSDCRSGPREILAPKSDISFQLKRSIEMAKYGVLVPINSKKELVEAMNLIIESDSLRDSYIKKGKSRAEYFNKTKIITEFLKIIDSN
jgi:N-acetylgalactosamine-N,N'-diacetylbacillosaminyl-diphospho-undecaprenol 4-alpha-N-acetylgalactosaminyltransferase